MTPPPPPVDQVIVTARLPQALGAPAFSTVALGRADLGKAVRLDEALSRTPGVSLFRRTSSRAANPTTQGLSLRAIAPSGAGRALVTLDGAPQNDPFGGWVIWTSLPVEGLERVTVARGAGAGPYGAGALTGAVELSGMEAPHVGLVRLTGYSSGIGRAAFALSEPLGPGDLLVVGSAERDRGWIPVRDRRGAADDRLRLNTANLSARYKARLGPAAIEARLASFQEDRTAGLRGAGSRARGLETSVAAAAAPSAERLGWRAQLWAYASDLRNRSVAVSVDRSSTTPANDQYATPALGVGANAALRGRLDHGEWELGGDVRLNDGESRERFRYQSGAFTRRRVAGGETVVGGLYGEVSQRVQGWLLTGDLRADLWTSFAGRRLETDLATGAATLDQRYPSRDEVVPSGRLGARRELGGGWFLRGAGYATFRPPTLNELYRPFRVGNDVTDANAGLRPERLYGVELGTGREGAGGRWAGTVFANRLDDPITNVTVGLGPGAFGAAGFIPAGGTLRQRRNAGQIDALGVEAEGERDLTERVQVRAAIGYTVARVEGGRDAPQLTGKRPAQAPRLSATAGVDWRATGKLLLSADLRAEGLRWEDDLNSRRLAPSISVDLRASYAVSPHAELAVAVTNLADAAVQTGRTADNIASYDAPRTARLELTLRR